MMDLIQDEEDIYDRVKLNQLKRRKKKKKKAQADYGDDETNNDGIVGITEKVKDMDEKLHEGSKGIVNDREKSKGSDKDQGLISLSDSSRKIACSLILKKLNEDSKICFFYFSNQLTELHKFRLFVYAVIYKQEQYFDISCRDSYVKIFNSMLTSKTNGQPFRSRFLEEGEWSENSSEQKSVDASREVEKIEIPSILIKRLNIQPDSQSS